MEVAQTLACFHTYVCKKDVGILETIYFEKKKKINPCFKCQIFFIKKTKMVNITRANRGVNANLSEPNDDNSFMNFTNESTSSIADLSSESTETRENLYKLNTKKDFARTPPKIEFQLYQSRFKSRKMRTFRKIPKESLSERNLIHSVESLPLNESDVPKKNLISKLKGVFSTIRDHKLDLSPKGGDPKRTQNDIYYFDRGNSDFLRTTDATPAVYSETLLIQTEYYANRVWAELFGILQIAVTFFLSFVLQFYRFILYSVFRMFIVGLFQITSDYFLKPLITVVYNSFIQPPFILLYNIMTSMQDSLIPLAQTVNNFLIPFTNILKSIRLITVNKHAFAVEDEIV